ncbi:MAG: Zn-dependent alcohol dehydrogenase [Acidimicrobiia bacterium]|nr:Zn-dependent alcohol dehydrogenase [Acidimicrobiia bacterium]
MKAAVLPAYNEDLQILEDLELEGPKANEIKVKVAASGVCHSDLSILQGRLPVMPPVILGHEGAGIVEEVGEGVTRFKPGDHVVISWVPQCGTCYTCEHGQPQLCETGAMVAVTAGMLDGTYRFTRDGEPIRQMQATGTFSEYTVVPEISAVKIDDDMPLDKAALIGCGVLTGVGAAVNVANVQKGDTVAVIGCGGVGLNAIQGARIAGAERIFAVDTAASKLDLAKEFGATDLIDASSGDPVMAVKEQTGIGTLGMPRGVDVTLEVVGFAETLKQAIGMTRAGGKTVFVGAPQLGATLELDIFMDLFAMQKIITGAFYGGSDVNRDVPKLVDLYKSGELKLDELVSRRIKLEDVNEAFRAIEKGEVARSVIIYD